MAQKNYLDYTQLQTFLAKLRNTFSASGHKHKKADITDFPTALKNPSSLTLKTNGTIKATYDGSTALSVDITADNVGAASVVHAHDDRYYTETEINTKIDSINESIDGKAAKSHKHSAADITSGTLSYDRLPSIPVGKLDGVIGSSNLPSYVDDVLEYENKTSFPTAGEAGKIYVDKNTNLTYRWSGTAYVEISPSLALGETSSTAFAGDKGKIAYNHSKKTGNPHGTKIADISSLQSTLDAKVPSTRKVNGKALSADITLAKGDVGLDNVDNTSDADKSVKSAESANTIVAVTTSGTGTAYEATVPGITELTNGVNFIMIPHLDASGTYATLNVNNLGAKRIWIKVSSSTGDGMPNFPVANFIRKNIPIKMVYSGTNWVIDNISLASAGTLQGTIPITKGGTGATTANQAITNLGGLSVVVSDTEPTNNNCNIWIKTS